MKSTLHIVLTAFTLGTSVAMAAGDGTEPQAYHPGVDLAA